MQMITIFTACLLLTTLFAGSTAFQCPANSEFTTFAQCDLYCGIPCDFKGVSNICLCRDGYLKDPQTMQCVPEKECSIPEDVPVLRSVVLMALVALTSNAAKVCDPIYEEYTDKAPCDDNCQNICTPMEDFCACRFGYLRDLSTGKCIPSDQCTPLLEPIKLDCLGL
uniref:TIL domain-containing protein n=1 Tax=Anopheles epiroticus TaxID=199890 RepID=A0A182P3S7_9DIPT